MSDQGFQEIQSDDAPRTHHARLAVAAVVFLAANLLHGADHIRQDLAGVDIEVFIGGAC